MQQEGSVRGSVAEGIATVTFHHPKSNALPGDILRSLADMVTAYGQDEAVRVIVLRSHGDRAFCAGASFDELKAIDDAEAGKEFFMGFARLILAMKKAPKFVIARVQGKAVGGGVGVISAADYALAVEGASVKLSELAVGIGPFVVGPAVERRAGAGSYAAMSIDADWRDAHWAHQQGLYAHLYASVIALDEAVNKLARRLARSNPEAMAELKRVFWAGTDHWDELLARRAEASGTLVLSDFTKNAIAAFANRGK